MRDITSLSKQQIFTVADLRKALEGKPDDMPILVEHTDLILRPIINVVEKQTSIDAEVETVLSIFCSKWHTDR